MDRRMFLGVVGMWTAVTGLFRPRVELGLPGLDNQTGPLEAGITSVWGKPGSGVSSVLWRAATNVATKTLFVNADQSHWRRAVQPHLTRRNNVYKHITLPLYVMDIKPTTLVGAYTAISEGVEQLRPKVLIIDGLWAETTYPAVMGSNRCLHWIARDAIESSRRVIIGTTMQYERAYTRLKMSISNRMYMTRKLSTDHIEVKVVKNRSGKNGIKHVYQVSETGIS